jgi:titin
VLAALPSNTTAHTDSGLPANTQFCYRVRARSLVGLSPYSDVVCGQTNLPPPAAPSGLAVSSTTASQINLTWNDNSSDEDGFKIERAPGTTASFSEIASAGAGVAAFSDTGLASATTFTYRVRAFGAGGNSTYSNTITGTTGVAPPSAPSNLILTSATTEQIAIAWNDNSSNETGFRIERAAGGPTGTFLQIATVGAGVVAFVDTGPGPNQGFTYRVRAFNAGGDSAPSNTVTGKTLVSYATQVHGFWASSGCTSCHVGSSPSGGLNLSGSASAIIPAVRARVDLAQACNSLILKKPSNKDCSGGTVSHLGGLYWSTGSPEYQTTRQWIVEGAVNN